MIDRLHRTWRVRATRPKYNLQWTDCGTHLEVRPSPQDRNPHLTLESTTALLTMQGCTVDPRPGYLVVTPSVI